MNTRRNTPVALAIVVLMGGLARPGGSAAVAGAATPPAPGDRREITTPPDRAAIEKVVADYVGLYARPTLDRWKTLFHTALTVVYPDDDGTIRARTLEQFFTAQKDYFETGRRISERLENVRIDAGHRIARVGADFIFVDEGVESRGKLGLHLAEGKEGWKVVGIIFSYDAP
ncbi:MAG TPA: nuclear transport factor 2 family protein [Candidatus Polarisedimenticolia bacterium]|nr:nuclear transport factor 2 family protein [Candidatus Polarisedimenticolia bacterium]